MSNRKWHAIVVISAVLLITLGALLGVAIYRQSTSSKVEPISTSLAVPAPEPKSPREVKDVLTNSDGDLIITYSDGSVQNAGRVVGQDGKGQAPTSAQIYAALLEYCANGTCNAKQPTQAQIIAALAVYCAGGVCKGDRGTDAQPITAEQIAQAVTDYCADGRCRGENGAAGVNGRDPVISCIDRSSERFVAWKYSDEPTTSYRNIYRLPLTAECDNPIPVEAA